jgi:hypothetical protein
MKRGRLQALVHDESYYIQKTVFSRMVPSNILRDLGGGGSHLGENKKVKDFINDPKDGVRT